MFIIDKTKNRIQKIEEMSFSSLGFTERAHLQEWIANNPQALGEDLLIIQKEFDGFNDTRERLDLLALDKKGNLVVIENKLDDSGRDVTWQALKYASYCSSLRKSEIIQIFQQYLDRISSSVTAEEQLSEFFQSREIGDIELNKGTTQRLMLVAASFRKEVTSTVMWLRNFKIKIQCFKVTPYQIGEQHLLDFEQIIPLKDAQDYIIRMEEKHNEEIANQDEIKERHIIRQEFWKQLLIKMNEKSTLFQNISPSKNNILSTAIGVRGFFFQFGISRNFAKCQVYIDKGDKEVNKQVFDLLTKTKEKLQREFGGRLDWERLNSYRASLIKYESRQFNVFEKEGWNEMVDFLVDGMVRLEKAFKNPLLEIHNTLKAHPISSIAIPELEDDTVN